MADAETMSPRPAIAYVDEDEDALQDFLIDAERSGLFHEVVVLKPEPRLDEMMEKLLALPIDALVSDFRLADASPVEYDGGGLVRAFLQARANFPCFIRTSYDDDALNGTDDVNRVYSKEDGTKGLSRSLFELIKLQVAHHRHRVERWSDELQALLDLPREDLSAAQVERIIELDVLVESQFGADHALTKAARTAIFNGDLHKRRDELAADTERLIADIRQALDTDTGSSADA